MILVTGVSGFIGNHLLDRLIEKYGKENLLALTSKPISKCAYLVHDNYNFKNSIFVDNGYENIQMIIHAGAFTPKNGKSSNDFLKCNSNIYNTEKLLNASLPNLKKIIYLSTLDVYSPVDIITENSITEPISLYGYSKLYCEKMINVFAQANNIVHQILRIGHVYGPGEEAYEKIIPVTMKKILNNDQIEIWGTGNEIRSFINIYDVIDSIINSLSINEFVGPVNLVSTNQISIRDLVQKILLIAESNATIAIISNTAKGRNLIFDNTKLKKHLLPEERNFDDGLLEEWKYLKTKTI